MSSWCAPDALSAFKDIQVVPIGASSCPESSWLEAAAELRFRQRPTEPVNYVNVGANKGYSALEFVLMWTQHRVSGQQWKRALLTFPGAGGWLRYRPCGNCNDCRRTPPPAHSRHGGVAHLLEKVRRERARGEVGLRVP